MKTSKTKIAHLVTKINEVLPDGDDVYGYAGINKAMITQSLNDSKNLLSAFKDYNETFEVVFLKRDIAQYVEWAISYLGNGINNENFEEFLRKIQLLRADIKTTYILVSQQPLRLDSAIAKAKEDLEEFTLSLNEISAIKEEITSAKDESNAIIESLSSEKPVV